MSAMADHLRELMAANGPLSVAQYMEEALTHPGFGYYICRDPFGRGGDFVTAPEISQMFGELIGLWCAVQWGAMGGPDPVNLVELGPGRGTMMADVLKAGRGTAGFLEALDISLVEISPALKAAQEDTLVKTPAIHAARSLSWLSDFSEIPDDPGGPLLLIANEFIDALPVRQFQMTAEGWRERMVGPDDGGDGDGGFQFMLADGPPPDGVIPPAFENALEPAPEGAIVETRPAAADLVWTIAERLSRQPGSALIIDYGHEESAAGDTLQAVKAHEFHDPLEAPGEADLTAHVDFAALRRAAEKAGAQVLGPITQGAFLQALGIGARADALMTASPDHRQDIEHVLNRLTSDDGMGRLFKVLALTSPGLPPPPGFD